MSPDILLRIGGATVDTIYMVAIAGLIGSLIGGPIGIFLATSGKGLPRHPPCPSKYSILSIG